jgi:hypothetical protein
MKKVFLLLTILIFVSAGSFAQNIKVPQAVREAFTAKFPDAENVKWEKENASEYEANFTIIGMEMSANFSKDGTWLETETSIGVDQLPRAVKDAINRSFSGGIVTEASRVEKADKTIQYEADIKVRSKKKEAVFDEKGNILEGD